MKSRSIWILLAIALVGLALAAAGCGGGSNTSDTNDTIETTASDVDDSASEDADEDSAAVEAEDEDEPADDDMVDDADEATDEDADAAADDATGMTAISSEECQELVSAATAFSSAMSGTGEGDLNDIAELFQNFADDMPEDIRDDFATLADAYAKLADALEGVDLSSTEAPSPEVQARLGEVVAELDQAEITAAGARIQTWTQENCTGAGG